MSVSIRTSAYFGRTLRGARQGSASYTTGSASIPSSHTRMRGSLHHLVTVGLNASVVLFCSAGWVAIESELAFPGTPDVSSWRRTGQRISSQRLRKQFSSTGCESSLFCTCGALVMGGGEFASSPKPLSRVCGGNNFSWAFVVVPLVFPLFSCGRLRACLPFVRLGLDLFSAPSESDGLERCRVRHGSVGAAISRLRGLANSIPNSFNLSCPCGRGWVFNPREVRKSSWVTGARGWLTRVHMRERSAAMTSLVGVRLGAFRAHPPISTQTRDTCLLCDRSFPCAQGKSGRSRSLLRDPQEVVSHCSERGMLRATHLGKAVTCGVQVLCDSAEILPQKEHTQQDTPEQQHSPPAPPQAGSLSLSLSLSHSHSHSPLTLTLSLSLLLCCSLTLLLFDTLLHSYTLTLLLLLS